MPKKTIEDSRLGRSTQISRTMIADTLSPAHEERDSDVDPSKNVPGRQHADDTAIKNGSSDSDGEGSATSLGSDRPSLSREQTKDSAVLSLASVQPRKPVFESPSNQFKALSTIVEMTPQGDQSELSASRESANVNGPRHPQLRTDAFELRSPTSIYSHGTDDPFVSPVSLYPNSRIESRVVAGSADTGPPAAIADSAQSEAPLWTILNDPRAHQFSFMQTTSDGWTADLDKFIYSKRRFGYGPTGTVIPKYASLVEHAKATSKQYRNNGGRSSIEQEFADAGYNHVREALEQQERGPQHAYDKTLPSPPVETFLPEVRGRLGYNVSTSRQPAPERLELAPTFLDRDLSPVRPPKPLRFSPRQNDGTGSPWRVTERGRDGLYQSNNVPTLLSRQSSLVESPQRSPSRIHRLRARLGRSPERSYSPDRNDSPLRRSEVDSRNRSPERRRMRVDSGATNLSLERLYLRPTWTSDGSSSPERRGRSRVIPESPRVQMRDNNVRPTDLLRSSQETQDEKHALISRPHHAPERSATMPLPYSEPIRANPEKLWGEKGLLSRPATAPQHPVGKAKMTPFKEMAQKLFKPKDPNRRAASETTGSPEAKAAEHDGKSKFPISVDRHQQMRLFGEVEYILQTIANDFLLEQMALGRLSAKSVKDAMDKWARGGRAQVIDFCFDLRIQLELVQQNLERLHFHGREAAQPHRQFVLIYAWKDVAREIAVRSFCSGDSAVKKMLSDCYVILDMLGAEGAYWLIFQKLHVTTLGRIAKANKERERAGQIKSGVTRQIVPGSPIDEDGDDEEENRTYRHLFEASEPRLRDGGVGYP